MKVLPDHVGIIMDGNGRWAKERRWPRVLGHREGAKAVRRAVEFAAKNKIKVLTLFALSVENRLTRPKLEVDYLFSLFIEALDTNIAELHEKEVKIIVIGSRQGLQPNLLNAIDKAQQMTCRNKGLQLVVALNFSGRWDICQAMRKLAKRVEAGELRASTINETLINENLAFAQFPNPDLLIRTSGEQRISNFMLWNLAYTELFFTEAYWPDFDEKIFAEALAWYCSRERRFGSIGEQLELCDA